uniref:Autophagy-related protein 101 n=1 Tax=Graphocephala atropunctata TaxID=36148 RepID=A0A1B6LAK4_9HEMI
MNAQTQTVQLQLEGYQVEEAVTSIFHTVMFHRTSGKFHYQEGGRYLEGTVGYSDIDCDFIDLTYVRCSSPKLDKNIRKQVSEFSEELRSSDSTRSGEISLKFFRRERAMWPFQSVCIPWEIWNVQLDLVQLRHHREQQSGREQMGELLTEKIVGITSGMSRNQYVPEVPSQPTDLCLIFDMSYEDCQPYLHEIVHVQPSTPSASIGHVLKNMFR